MKKKQPNMTLLMKFRCLKKIVVIMTRRKRIGNLMKRKGL